MVELDSTSRAEEPSWVARSNPSNKAVNSAKRIRWCSKEEPKVANTTPWWSHKTTTVAAISGFPLEQPSTLNFSTLGDDFIQEINWRGLRGGMIIHNPSSIWVSKTPQLRWLETKSIIDQPNIHEHSRITTSTLKATKSNLKVFRAFEICHIMKHGRMTRICFKEQKHHC